MLKKILVLAASAFISLNASAGYVQYDFTGGSVAGFFIQHESDKSIAYYQVSNSAGVFFNFGPSGHFSNLSQASSNFWGSTGPTNFTVYSDLTDLYREQFSIDFSATATPGQFQYAADYSAYQNVPISNLPPFPPKFGSFSGFVTQSAPSDFMINFLDSYDGYPDGINRLVPTQNVPEPGSLALLALGAAAALRSRKSKRAA